MKLNQANDTYQGNLVEDLGGAQVAEPSLAQDARCGGGAIHGSSGMQVTQMLTAWLVIVLMHGVDGFKRDPQRVAAAGLAVSKPGAMRFCSIR